MLQEKKGLMMTRWCWQMELKDSEVLGYISVQRVLCCVEDQIYYCYRKVWENTDSTCVMVFIALQLILYSPLVTVCPICFNNQ
jgi:hypothetical protein